MRFSLRILTATAAIGIVVAACGGGGSQAPTTSQPAASQPAASAGQPSGTTISVGATEFAFDPATIVIPAGGGATVTLINKGTVEHDITVDALSVKIFAKPGDTVSGTVTAKAGTYEFYCSIPGHKQAGMVGTLTVN